MGVYALFGLMRSGVLTLGRIPLQEAERPLTREVLFTMTGRTDIFRDVFRLLGERPRILALGLSEESMVKLCREYAKAAHSHNSFLHMLLLLGVPGLLFAVWLTARVVRSAFRVAFTHMDESAMSDKLIALFVVALLMSAVLEVYLFADHIPVVNFVFLLLSGYLMETDRRLRGKA